MYLYRSYLQFSIHVFFLAQLFSELKSLKNLWSLDEVGIASSKMTVRGTMVRSEVCNSWCFCLES